MPKQKRRPYAVEKHPKRVHIERMLAEGLQISYISKKFGISRQALVGYKTRKLPEKVKAVAKRKDITNANELFNIILKTVRRMEKLSDSCDDYLQDPDRPDMYFMGPQSHEIYVVYLNEVPDGRGGIKQVKEKATMQELIHAIEDGGHPVVGIRTTHADPRTLLIRTSETLTKQMDMLVQAWKAVDQGKNSFLGTPEWDRVVKIILDATESHPEIRRDIANGLSVIGVSE